MNTIINNKIIRFSLLLLGISLLSACSPYKNLESLKSMKDLNYPYEVSYARLPGNINMAYVDEGKGEQAIIFIHGLGSYLPAWKKNIEGLKDKYRCIAVDLPGYGKSSKDPHSGMMSFYASVLMDFITELGLEKPVIAGHSMGGQIAMLMGLAYPDKIDKLVLVSPAGFERFSEGQKQWFREVMSLNGVKKTTAEQIHTNLAYNFYNMPKDAAFMITDRIAMREAKDFDAYCYIVAKSVEGMVDEPLIDKLQSLGQQSLIIFGCNDNLIPNRYLNPGSTKKIAETGAEKIKNAKLVMIPRCGHFAQFEKAEEVNNAIRDFLK